MKRYLSVTIMLGTGRGRVLYDISVEATEEEAKEIASKVSDLMDEAFPEDEEHNTKK